MTKRHMFHLAVLSALVVALMTGRAYAAANSDQVERVQKSMEVLRALTSAEDSAIPEYILERAEAIIVIPSYLKGGFVVGAEHGKGIMSVRDRTANSWSLPAFVSMSGGSFGAQIGLQSVDLVLVVVNRDSVAELLKNKFTFGGDLSVAAGPVGRSTKAATDLKLEAKILAYSRAKGLFAGATLNGTALQADEESNGKFYGKRLITRAIVLEHQVTGKVPAGANEWREMLKRITSTTRQTQ
jgi:lipid-binding SYLF domain-containing protein